MDEMFKELNEEMINQNIPEKWRDSVLSGMNHNQKRIDLMMRWLIEHRDVDYEAIDLVKAKLEIKDKVPVYLFGKYRI